MVAWYYAHLRWTPALPQQRIPDTSARCSPRWTLQDALIIARRHAAWDGSAERVRLEVTRSGEPILHRPPDLAL